ncbi:MAG: penicillin acylase family protein [Pirellulales bacterium]|nr:penicillin acylase family protein [Pirellulales bacterium]
MKRRPRIWRDHHGVPHIEAADESGLYWGQGYVHARDRGLQMLLMRILVQGRASEYLDSRDATLEIDRFFRRMNWSGGMESDLAALTPKAKEQLAHYCDGVNCALAKRCPWELRLLGYRPEPWSIGDSIAVSRMIGYLTLGQSQAEMERLVVEMIQAGVPLRKLEELFPGLLGGLDRELIERVRLHQRVVPPEVKWGVAVPRMMASNNWVVAGDKTASRKPILANDPHLEGNRLPNVWCEVVLRIGDRYAMGGSMPGGAGVLIGRTNDVAWGATYAFLDAVDSWVERCRDGKYYREPDGWLPFRQRKELIKRKKKPPVETTFYENDHGVLDGDPYQQGHYLCTRWAPGTSGGTTLSRILEMWSVTDVEQGMDVLGRVETAWSFVLADRHGNIGFQMSGLMPKRRAGASGLIPLAGWKPENDWSGFVSHRKLPRCLNPPQGFFVTANNDLNEHGRASPINLPMAPYRADRIACLLRERSGLTPSDMFRMQFDVYSTQAATYLEILRPLLPDTAQGHILRDWDLRYAADSRGAFLFEVFYKSLCREVFGLHGLGEAVADHLLAETGAFVDFYGNFDRVLLSEESAWFDGQTRDDVYRRVAADALSVEPRTWGETQRYVMRHLLLGGRLPRIFGFDKGPVALVGGRATIHQGQIYRSGGRTTTFVPSFRLVADLAEDACHTNMAGGPSDRRFSRWYCSDVKRWLAGEYKTVSADGAER